MMDHATVRGHWTPPRQQWVVMSALPVPDRTCWELSYWSPCSPPSQHLLGYMKKLSDVLGVVLLVSPDQNGDH